jgi:hypothetical protein
MFYFPEEVRKCGVPAFVDRVSVYGGTKDCSGSAHSELASF